MDSVRNVLITVRGIQEISETELEYMESRLPAYSISVWTALCLLTIIPLKESL